MGRVEVGFFSLSGHSTTGNDRPYLDWHQLDHMPEQYQLPGVVLGQRWASTPACRATRAASVGPWDGVEHVVCYLMGAPVDQTIDDFYALGQELADRGRFPEALPSAYAGALELVETEAAPRVLVSPEVVPFRPHRGIYLVVEKLEGDGPLAPPDLAELVAVPGVAGAWSFATSTALHQRRFTDGRFRMTIGYLDEDPSAVAGSLRPVVERQEADGSNRLVLAAPFESMMAWEWGRFGAEAPSSAVR
jgi:hypothetical protein